MDITTIITTIIIIIKNKEYLPDLLANCSVPTILRRFTYIRMLRLCFLPYNYHVYTYFCRIFGSASPSKLIDDLTSLAFESLLS